MNDELGTWCKRWLGRGMFATSSQPWQHCLANHVWCVVFRLDFAPVTYFFLLDWRVEKPCRPLEGVACWSFDRHSADVLPMRGVIDHKVAECELVTPHPTSRTCLCTCFLSAEDAKHLVAVEFMFSYVPGGRVSHNHNQNILWKCCASAQGPRVGFYLLVL